MVTTIPGPTEGFVPIRRAILSVSDKRGLIELARALADRGVALLASGGTRTALADAGSRSPRWPTTPGSRRSWADASRPCIPGSTAESWPAATFPKTCRFSRPRGSTPIDLVVVNLYPFEATIANLGATFEEAVENIDIGGPSLIRAAAKNHDHVAVLTDPDQYAAFIAEFLASGGTTRGDPQAAGPCRLRATGAL